MSRILVVDDKPIFRETIAYVLRQNGYQAVSAANGLEALEILQKYHLDLILLDVGMPVMDGITCLKKIREDPKFRDLPVILLTAVTEREIVMSAARYGVRDYLLKSRFSNEEMLRRIKERLNQKNSTPEKNAEEKDGTQTAVIVKTETSHNETKIKPKLLRDKIEPSRAHILQACEREFQIGAMPDVLREVLVMCDSAATAMDDIASSTRKDPVLAARVLRVANSSFFGTDKPATDLITSVRRMGTQGVRNIVLGLLVMDHFSYLNEHGFHFERYWEHTVGTAILAESLARLVNHPQPEHMFLAGLLHDLGRLVLLSLLPDSYSEIMKTARETGRDLSESEQQSLGITHAEVTRSVLHAWRVPQNIIEAAGDHGKLATMLVGGRHSQDSLIVALANRLAHALILGDSGNPVLLECRDHVRAFKLDTNDLIGTIQVAAYRAEEMRIAFIAMSTQSVPVAMVDELARTGPSPAPRVAVLPGVHECNPAAMFFERLHWLTNDHPEVVVLCPQMSSELPRLTATLDAMDAKAGVRLPVLLLSNNVHDTNFMNETKRKLMTLSSTCGYTTLIEAIKTLRGPVISAAQRPESAKV